MRESIYDSDEVYKFLIARLKSPSASRSFLRADVGFDAWARQTRDLVRRLLLYAPERVPFEPRLLEELDFGSYTRRKISFHTAADCPVPAYLLIPKGIQRPAPAVVALHDHSGRFYWGKEKIVDHRERLPLVDWFQGYRYGKRGFASALAELGYVVIVIDALGWGERGWLGESWLREGSERLDNLEPGSEAYIREYDRIWSERGFAKMVETVMYAGATYMGIMTWDDIRSVDFLCSLPEVDPGRIGCMGLSYGGYRAVMLGALDERIRCSCPVGFMARFSDMVPYTTAGISGVIPGLFDELPFPDLASLACPRPMFALSCLNDKLFDQSSSEKAVETIRSVYRKAGAEGAFRSKGYPVGHQFDRSMQEEAFQWLREVL